MLLFKTLPYPQEKTTQSWFLFWLLRAGVCIKMLSDKYFQILESNCQLVKFFWAIPCKWEGDRNGSVVIKPGLELKFVASSVAVLIYVCFLLYQTVRCISNHDTKTTSFYFLYAVLLGYTLAFIIQMHTFHRRYEIANYLKAWCKFLDKIQGIWFKLNYFMRKWIKRFLKFLFQRIIFSAEM